MLEVLQINHTLSSIVNGARRSEIAVYYSLLTSFNLRL